MKAIIPALLALLPFAGFSQAAPQYDIFKATVYGFNEKKILTDPYHEGLLAKARKIDAFKTKKLDFPKQDCGWGIGPIMIEDDPIFGYWMDNTIRITESSCYSFTLHTDDGSYLWIDDELIVDNSGDHKMVKKSNQKHLEPGNYKMAIWYYQLHGPCGLIFDSENLGYPCPEEKEAKVIEKPISFSLNSQVLFDVNESSLKEAAFQVLDSISQLIQHTAIQQIKVLGHTDNTGTDEYNQVLSQTRAESVKQYLLHHIEDKEITAIGLGSSQPIDSNETAAGRQQNRRVEIVVDKK